jgi:hypothetical protein
MLGWWRQLNGRFMVVWFQCSQSGWDPYAGSQFIMEFSQGTKPLIGAGDLRARLPRLLPPELFEEVRALQNTVLAALRPPPRSHEIFRASAEVRQWYMRQFAVVSDPYVPQDDIWFRYFSLGDVRRWGEFILHHLPQIEDQARSQLALPAAGAA